MINSRFNNDGVEPYPLSSPDKPPLTFLQLKFTFYEFVRKIKTPFQFWPAILSLTGLRVWKAALQAQQLALLESQVT